MKLALGTVQFGMNYGVANQDGRVSLEEARAILACASSSGMDTLDTATSYGDSEQRLGEVGVEGWRIVSKLPSAPTDCNDFYGWAAAAVEASLCRCRTSALYGLLLHRPQQLLETGGEQLFAALLRLKDDGMVRKIGISIYEPAELDVLVGRYPLDLVQAPFNILDRRLIETGWLNRLNAQGTELHVRSIFLQGLLLMEPGQRPPKFNRWATLWRDYDEWLAANRLTPQQACVRHALSIPQIAKVIVGVDRVAQLEEILRAADGSATPLPSWRQTADADLLNPARWAAL